jgi:hypothetical protein
MEANQAQLRSLGQLAIAIAVAKAVAVAVSLVVKLLVVRLRGQAGS